MNASQIADDVQRIIEEKGFIGKKGTGSSSIRNSISEGLTLLDK